MSAPNDRPSLAPRWESSVIKSHSFFILLFFFCLTGKMLIGVEDDFWGRTQRVGQKTEAGCPVVSPGPSTLADPTIDRALGVPTFPNRSDGGGIRSCALAACPLESRQDLRYPGVQAFLGHHRPDCQCSQAPQIKPLAFGLNLFVRNR